MKLIDFIAYTDIGNPSTPKQIEFKALIKSFKNINDVFVRDNYSNDKLYTKVIPSGNKIPLVFSFIKKYFFHSINSRKFSMQLFDFFLSRKLSNRAQISYFLTHEFPKSIKRSKELKRKVICQEMVAHSGFVAKLLNKEYKKWGINRRIKEENFSHSNIDFFFVISDYIKETFLCQGIPKEKIIVIPYGGSPSKKKQKAKTKKQDFVVLFVGSSFIIKGVPYLLEAWRALNLKKAKLKLIGIPGPEFNSIKTHFDLTNVELLGFQNPEKYYSEADLFISATLSDGRSKVVAEALSHGIPTITTENDGACDLIKDNGIVIPAFSSRAIAEAITKVIQHYDKFYKNTTSSLKGYTWEENSKKIPRIIENEI